MALSVRPDTFSSLGGDYTIVITKSSPLSLFTSVIISEVDWCTELDRRLVDDWTYEIDVRVSEENTGHDRILSVLVETEDEQHNFAIVQQAGTAVPELSGEIKSVTPSSDIIASSGTLTVDVKTVNGTDSLASASVISGSFCTLTSTTHGVTSGSDTVTRFVFTFAENTNYSTRSAVLNFTVSNGTNTYVLSLTKTQAAAEQENPVEWIVSIPAITAEAGETTKSVQIYSEGIYANTFSVTSKPAWVTSCSFNTVNGVTTLTVNFQANTSSDQRSGSIIVSVRNIGDVTVTSSTSITQAGASYRRGHIVVSNKSVGAEETSASVPVYFDYMDMSSIDIEDVPAWVSSAQIHESEGNYYLDLSIDENTSHEERKGTIRVTGEDLGGNIITSEMIVVQVGAKIVHDRIYRIDYDPEDDQTQFVSTLLYEGELEFSTKHPIESVVHFETYAIQKIYWVDGEHVLRFMNFMAEPEERATWDDTTFDSNRISGFGVDVLIKKDNSGETRANGVTQYILTYFNKHGQETGYVWMSDLVYLSPLDKGGAADGKNNNRVALTFSNLDTSFTHFRVYSIFRSSFNGQVVAYLVDERKTSDDDVIVVDDGAHLELQDTTRLLYLGSQSVKAGTLEHKDNTLFLGDLQSVGKADYSDLEELLRNTLFVLHDDSKGFQDGVDYESNCIQFVYSGPSRRTGSDILDIPNVENSGNYPYISQLQYTSSQILSFKGGEKYRFALKFQMRDGTETDAFWIGDKENTYYPVMDTSGNVINRICALCTLPYEVIDYLRKEGKYKTVRLCIAEASSADRSVKAQGIVNPTMFNTWERFRGRVYSYPSWITRVRGAEFANMHFQTVECADKTTGEIQCNYWKDGQDFYPYYQYKNYDTAPTYLRELCGGSDFDKLIIAYRVRYKKDDKMFGGGLYNWTVGILTGGAISLTAGTIMAALAKAKAEFVITAYIIKIKMLDGSQTALDSVNNKFFPIYDKDVGSHPDHNDKKAFNQFWTPYGNDSVDSSKKNWYYYNEPRSNEPGDYLWRAELTMVKVSGKTYFNKGRARSKVEERMKAEFLSLGLGRYFPHSDIFHQWCVRAINESNHTYYMNQQTYKDNAFPVPYDSLREPYYAINPVETNGTYPSQKRWVNKGDYSVSGVEGDTSPAYYKKHLMFVDENVVTLDSPELNYEAVQMDGADYSFRIVGVAKMSSVISDYTVDASKSTVPGESLDKEIFSGNVKGHNRIDGLVTWPLWKEYGLALKNSAMDDNVKDEDRTFSDYELTMQIVRYWLYMWQHSGCITGFTQTIDDEVSESDEEGSGNAKDLIVPDGKYSELKHKTWANLRYAYETMYLSSPKVMPVESIRTPLEFNTNMLRITVGDELKDYASNVQLNMLPPGDMKYPICYSGARPDDTNKLVTSDEARIYSSAPVLLEYATKTHAVISFFTNDNYPVIKNGSTNYYYMQTILPRFFESEEIAFDLKGETTIYDEESGVDVTYDVTGALLPWVKHYNGEHYIHIHRNGNDIANPAYSMINYQDADVTNVLKTSGTGVQFQRYVEVLQRAGEAFEDGSIYIEIHTGNVNQYGQLTSGARFIVNVEDAAVSFDENTGIYTVSFSDPRSIGYADVDNGYDETIGIDYSIAMYDSNGIVFNYIGAADYDIATNVISDKSYPYRDYIVNQDVLDNRSFFGNKKLEEGDPYVFIGEIYVDYSDPAVRKDTRYGGISLSDVSGNRFINAGPAYPIDVDGNSMDIVANQGDTYFQRFDSLRIKPYSSDALNQVMDISSVMLETHINLDGRTDFQRGINELASIDTTTFGQINRVYSQKDNFVIKRDLDEDFNTDSYRTSVTWTLPKADMASVDEWTHITLASTLKLDGDKGICNALRRFQNRLLAFQDKGISEIYFNAVTQLGTQEGVPIEIANSGKVTGKGYFTNTFGCTNKWSIVEGKAALYFVDNINKAFCSVVVGQRGQLGASDISTGKGFKVWFGNRNVVEPWRPYDFRNIVSFVDEINSDVYLVRSSSDSESPCLVYNELLGEFTSFFDYSDVPMITNVKDRLVSFKNHRLWLQNEGAYCNFFGEQKDFWMHYRVTPDPYKDKIWTNLEYRADFYRVLDEDEDVLDIPERSFEDDAYLAYQPDETFDYIRFWNEYQTTDIDESYKADMDKKFRIWRYQIPRARKENTNIYGLDRMRNPWLNILLKKKYTGSADETNQDLMQMHDMTVIYFE